MKNDPRTHDELISRISGLLEYRGVARRRIKSRLAGTCGITTSAVHQWFNTTKNIRHEHLVAIAKEFGVTLDWLLTGKGEMNILPATGALPTTSDSAPARSSEKLDAARVLVDTSKSELLALAQEFEADDVETAYRLTKLAIKVDQIKALL